MAACADAELHAQLEQRWRGASTPQEELRYLNALVDTPDTGRFDHALELAATEVRTQNAPYMLRRALTHPALDGRARRLRLAAPEPNITGPLGGPEVAPRLSRARGSLGVAVRLREGRPRGATPTRTLPPRHAFGLA